MKIIETNLPCDTLIIKEKLIYGCYNHEEGERNGEVIFLSLDTKESKSFKTTGTFCIKEKDDLVYAANVFNLQIYKSEELIQTIQTKRINTHISLGDSIGVTNTEGELKIYKDCKEIQNYFLTKNTLWSVDQKDNLFVAGGEEKSLFFIDTRMKSHFSYTTEMVSSVKFINDYVYTGMYDGRVCVYDLRMNKLSEQSIGGQVWQLNFYNDFFISSCVYDGVKVLDSEFRLVYEYKPESIVYTADCKDGMIVFASFYEKRIYVDDVDWLIK